MQELSPRQEALYAAYEIIAESFGMFDQSSGADGAHYMSEDDNPFIAEGLNCANCCFYEGGQACEIVEGQIHPDALCKLWVIKEQLISDDAIEKASFGGDRSAAAQYAARVRWGSSGASRASTTPQGGLTNPNPTQVTKDQVPAFIDGLLSGDGSENLTDYNVSGTNYFNQDRAGALSRREMPQVPSTRKEEFLADISQKGLTYKHESVNPASLKPTQREINGKSSAEIMQRESRRGADAFSATPAKSIIVSSDGFVMDGHHRWAGAALLNLSGTPTNISIVRVNARQKDLIGLMKTWSSSKGIASQGFSEHNYPSVGKTLAFHKACELALSTQKEYGDDIHS